MKRAMTTLHFTSQPTSVVIDYAAAGLDDTQIAHLRHIENLANQLDGDWSRMGTADPGQEWLDAYRYQLAKAAYSLGLAHFHRLPAAPCVFKPIYESIMRKMLRRDVWGYWKDTSQSGKFINPDLQELRTPWIDPVVKENIMYSGHLHAMAGMYAVLFEYDFRKLNDVIYWQMVESGWLGVPCEPNCVFLICNQFPMLGFRFHDHRYGTSISSEATAAYRDAWERKGMLDKQGHFHYFWRIQQDNFFSNGRVSSDAWLGAVMHAWNPEVVRELYPQQAKEWFKHTPDGLVSLLAPTVVQAIHAAGTVGDASCMMQDLTYKWTAPEFGYAAIWASELGDQKVLDGLLAHADLYMEPTYERGGLYYPRNDRSWDAEGNMTYMDPLTGNALIAYARLNVPNGLMHLYNQPWEQSHFLKPALIDMNPRLDVMRAVYQDSEELLLTLRGRKAAELVDTTLTIGNVPPNRKWSLSRDGVLLAHSGDVARINTLHVEQRKNILVFKCQISEATDLSIRWE